MPYSLMMLLMILTLMLVVCLVSMIHMRREEMCARARERRVKAYVAHMSHELRTPVNAISGLCEMMEAMPDMPGEAQACLRRMHAASRCAVELASGVLDMSSLEHGKMRIALAPYSIRELAGEAVDVVAAQAEQKGVSLSVMLNLRDSWAQCDALRLRQVLVNLLNNAVKFTPVGGTVSLSVWQDGQANNRIGRTQAIYGFAVTDTGRGIAPENLGRVFHSYEQAGEGGGAGLGLAISQGIVERLGGRLRVKSEPDRGSRFEFRLRLSLCEPERKGDAQADGNTLAGLRVMLVEDNALSADITRALLEQAGAQVENAASGEEATARFDRAQAGTFDVILMDMHMPGMDGPDAVRAIRALERADAPRVRIIALSAGATRDEMNRAREAGMDGYLIKPVETAVLITALAGCRLDVHTEEGASA